MYKLYMLTYILHEYRYAICHIKFDINIIKYCKRIGIRHYVITYLNQIMFSIVVMNVNMNIVNILQCSNLFMH